MYNGLGCLYTDSCRCPHRARPQAKPRAALLLPTAWCWCCAGAPERREDHVLRDFVDSESRNYSGERFNRFVAELHSRIKTLVQR